MKKLTLLSVCLLGLMVFFSPSIFANDQDVLQTLIGEPGTPAETVTMTVEVQPPSNKNFDPVKVVKQGQPTGETFGGTITYDPKTNTLTLNNLKDSGQIDLRDMGDLTIHLIGENTFYETANIFSRPSSNYDDTSITFTGNGSLSFDTSSFGGDHAAIICDDLKIESGTFNIAKSWIVAKSVTINGGTINMYGRIATISNPHDRIIINGGQTNIDGSMNTNYFQMNGGSLVVNNSSQTCIKANQIMINGGRLISKNNGQTSDEVTSNLSALERIDINGGTVFAHVSKAGSAALSAPVVAINQNASILVGGVKSGAPWHEPTYNVSGYNKESYVLITGADIPTDDIITGDISYRTHVQNVGWQGLRAEGNISGTSGQGYRLEGIEINYANTTEDSRIRYRTHVQNIGWQDWTYGGSVSGTSGKSLRLEAINLELIGSDANRYDVYYCVHAQNFGWLGWAKNGENAGTAGYGYRLEGIKIMVVPKGSPAPSPMSELQPFSQV